MTDEVLILVNPKTGHRHTKHQVPQLCVALQQCRLRPRVVVTRSADDLTNHARGATNAKAVVIVGGDGTWHAALQGLATTDIPVALLPVGTGNDNARSLPLPRNGPRGLARAIAEGTTEVITLGRAEWQDKPPRWFSGILTAGFDSAVNQRANEIQRLRGTSRYVLAIAQEMGHFGPLQYQVTVDDDSWEGEAILASVGNSAYYGGGMKMCPHADIFSPNLAVTIVEYVGLARFAAALPSLFWGGHVKQPYVRTLTGSRVTIAARGPAVFADGEPLGVTPMTATCHAGALRVVSAS